MLPWFRLALALGLTLGFALPAAADVLPHAAQPDSTPTYDGSGEVVEPDVLYVPEGWHGYEYWMALTPYTCGDETTENPSILAGHDGRHWETPVSGDLIAPAPLVGNSSPCYPFFVNNDDPSLVLAGDSLFIYYNVTYTHHGPKAGSTEVHRIASADGVHWTPGDLAPVMWTRPNYMLSPSVVWNDGVFYAWYVQMNACDTQVPELRRRWSTDGVTWPNGWDEVVPMDTSNGFAYHVTVKLVGGVYAMLYVAYPVGGNCTLARSLYYAESPDGRNWQSLPLRMLSPSSAPGAWDNATIYRSSFVGRYPNLRVWYSASSDSVCLYCNRGFSGSPWHLGYTEIENYLAPAGIQVDTTAVAFEPVIQGAQRPQRGLDVRHLQRIPADDLYYTITSTPGFDAVPSGNFAIGVGGLQTHQLEMETDTPGIKYGAVQIASNAPGEAMAAIRLSGLVLRHAIPSLDSSRVTVRDTVDFGSEVLGRFTPRAVRVHNLGFGPLQAQLRLEAASFEGGAGRFSISGGFRRTLVGDARTLPIEFDDSGATLDSTYTATLVLTDSDEGLPGALSMPPLTVFLAARATDDPLRAPGAAAQPIATRVYPPYPNPLTGASTVRFDLARSTTARLEVFDLTGRRVALLAQRRFEPGRFEVRWDGRTSDGPPAGPGLYFVRLSGDRIDPAVTRLAVER